jgi:hypothetical protein
MFQTIQGHRVFVVDLPKLPELPITDGGDRSLRPYADALELAILQRIIKEPGKYGIELTGLGTTYNIYAIQE